MQIGIGCYQLSLVNAFQPLELIRDVPQLLGRSTQDDHFEADIVRQVHVGRGDDQIVVVVLQASQLLS